MGDIVIDTPLLPHVGIGLFRKVQCFSHCAASACSENNCNNYKRRKL